MQDNADILLFLICFFVGQLICDIMSLIKQKYIEKNITTKHTKFSNSKNGMTRKYCAYYGYDLDKLQLKILDKKQGTHYEIYDMSEYALDSEKEAFLLNSKL